ncbi:MAG: hypothetical protein HOF37_02000 [Rhodobacterales bacterium]|nr:hypothetical protein [Rhodobacterales bacterium]MBT6834048.1 hypothetical protein [Rhodobacterales bacterium]MDB2418817.1 hypothetical protein [Amylibacter sp.]
MSFINKVLLPIILIISFISIAWGENIIPSEVVNEIERLQKINKVDIFNSTFDFKEIRNVNLLD